MDTFWAVINWFVALYDHTPRWLAADLTIMAVIFPFALAVVWFARNECNRRNIMIAVEKNPFATAKEVAVEIGLTEGQVSDFAFQLRLEGKIPEDAIRR